MIQMYDPEERDLNEEEPESHEPDLSPIDGVLWRSMVSILRRRNGRVVIEGTDVESFSRGTNRSKGGLVQIN